MLAGSVKKCSSVKRPATQTVALRTGSVVFAPTRTNLTIETEFGLVKIDRGAVVLVVALPTAVAVYNLHDDYTNDVTMTIRNKTLSLTPGRHLLLTDESVNSLDEISPLGRIGHRRIESRAHGDYLKEFSSEFSSEFSVPSALNTLKLLSSMQNSSSPRDARIMRKLMKTAAVLNHTGASKGAYRPVTKRDWGHQKAMAH